MSNTTTMATMRWKIRFYESEQNPGGWLGILYILIAIWSAFLLPAGNLYGTDADLKQYGDRAHGHLYGLV